MSLCLVSFMYMRNFSSANVVTRFSFFFSEQSADAYIVLVSGSSFPISHHIILKDGRGLAEFTGVRLFLNR